MIAKRVVLDTNVCLDLFFFHDARWALMLAALKDGTIEAVTRDDCRTEWRIVLDYPHLGLDNAGKAQCASEFDSLVTCIPTVPPSAAQVCLPLCSDPDDQKFLELARDAQAATLITKDKALLKLARKTAVAGLFSIVRPDAWIRADAAHAAPIEKIED